MEEVYDLHQHKNCVAFFLGYNKIRINGFSTSTRNFGGLDISLEKDTFIVYDKRRKNILSWGDSNSKIDKVEDAIIYDKFEEKLCHLFEKNKDNWDQDDMFLLQAASDFMRLSIKEVIKESKEIIKGANTFHYIVVTPSEWKKEIREAVIRPIFVNANLISNEDHKDMLLFCSDLEAVSYNYATSDKQVLLAERGENTVTYRIINLEKNEVLIKLDLISALNPLFDFSDSSMFIKVISSKSFSFTVDNINNSIKSIIKTHLPVDLQDKIIQKIETRMEYLCVHYEHFGFSVIVNSIMKPLILDISELNLNEQQDEFLKSISIFDICSKFCKPLSDNLEYIFPDKDKKRYDILESIDDSNFPGYFNRNLIIWAKYILEYIKLSSNSKNIVCRDGESIFLGFQPMSNGAKEYVFNATRSSNMYSKPCILPTYNLNSRLSIFLKSKPDAIMNIDITLESTLLFFSLLDANGSVKEIMNHKDFLTDSCLRSLGSFFSFSEATTLNVKHFFITFVEKYFTGDTTYFVGDNSKTLQKFIDFGRKRVRSNRFFKGGVKGDNLKEDILMEVESILCGENDKEETLVSIQQQNYVMMFLQIYMTYISKVVSNKLSTIKKYRMKIGYAVTIEQVLLKKLFGTKDNLRDVMYTSGMLSKDDSFKKLRIITRGEDIFPVIQQYFKLRFPIKSYFVLAQLHEDYVQLILNQVVTEKENQEAIAVRDEIIPIPNIYNSLFLNMWNKIVKDNSLIQLCDTHKTKDRIELQEIFSLKNSEEFKRNFKYYISEQILKTNSKFNYIDRNTICFSISCKCRVCLTVNDIIEISFRPAIRSIISIVSTSLTNDQFFGKYINIQSLFYLIGFNYNPQFQPILMKILQDETDQFMYERKIGTPHYTLPILSNELLYPVLWQQPLSYRGFLVGTLHLVQSENYGFNFECYDDKARYVYKSKRSDTKTIPADEKAILLLFKRGDKISSGQTDRIFYLNSKQEFTFNAFIKYFRLKRINGLTFDKSFSIKNMSEEIRGSHLSHRLIEDIPTKVSVVYNSYLSSISLKVGFVGREAEADTQITIGEPMTLARF